MNQYVKYGLLCWFVFSFFAVPDYPKRVEPEYKFGYTDAELAVRLAEMDADDKPYVPDTPQPGERGYGQPIVIVQGAPAAPAQAGPILVTPVYSCEQSEWLRNPKLVYQYRPCGSRRNPWWEE